MGKRVTSSCERFVGISKGGCDADVPNGGCGDTPPPISSDDERLKPLVEQLTALLRDDGVRTSRPNLFRLAYYLDRSVRRRRALTRSYAKDRLTGDDIIRLIAEARDAGDNDEAFWRAFLAAHLGRDSADPQDQRQVTSAARLLSGFGKKPMWTWAAVSANPGRFRMWLIEHEDDLWTLMYGNHRKMEAKKPEIVWQVIDSFLTLVDQHGGHPTSVFKLDVKDGCTPAERFDALYRRLKGPLFRFGRTGVFDLLALLDDLKLVDASPGRCYLRGSTGPLDGARRLWGHRPTSELDDLAARLARNINVSPLCIEDALCNWQK